MITARKRLAATVGALALVVGGLGSATALAKGPSGSPGNSASDITGSFSADCTDFESTSSKDFSHIDFVFADGSTSTVSTFDDTHHYTLTGDKQISTATVKAGTTSNTYSCTPQQEQPACSNNVDDDGDGKVDAADPGCSDANDDDETDPAAKPACSDGVDNDGDGKVDYPADPGCANADDTDETDATPPPPANPCAKGGLTSVLTGTDDPTLAKAGYDAILKNIPPVKDPHAGGPLSSALETNLEPLNPVGHEAACAVSLVDGP